MQRVSGTGFAPALSALSLLLLTACSSGSTNVVNRPTTAPSSAAASGTPTASAPALHQSLTVQPSTGLAAHQRVQVVATGFSPGEALVVTECAAKGKKTGAGDCNLSGMLSVQSDTKGEVRTPFVVLKGPFGSNHITCVRPSSCLVSVTQATLSPSEEADAAIAFR